MLTIEDWISIEDISFLVELYRRDDTNQEFHDILKVGLIKRLELPDEDSFQLWIELF
jgi:hypothetical protein